MPDWKEIILQMASEGAADIEYRAKLLLSKELFYAWLEREPEFCETIEKARNLSALWWWEKARKDALEQGKINPTVFNLNMKNRFKDDWKDKVEQELYGKDGTPLGIEVTFVGKDKG
jgi:hypothetical protein